jgi:hypothetical protein
MWNAFTKNIIYFFSDNFHIMKKFRNNIFRSFNENIKKTSKQMYHKEDKISWDHIELIYKKDLEEHYTKVTPLTSSHIYLTSKTMMNTKYALDICTERVIDMAKKIEGAEGTVWYLELGLRIKKLILLDRKIKTKEDEFFKELESVLKELEGWEDDNKGSNLTHQSIFDIKTTIKSLNECKFILIFNFKVNYLF